MRPEYERLQEVGTVQCIWQQPAPHTRDFDDSTLMNHQLPGSMQAMYRQRLFTDAAIMVEGKTLHVHRAVLAAASPVFQRMFSSHMQEGEHTCVCCCSCTSVAVWCNELRSVPEYAGVIGVSHALCPTLLLLQKSSGCLHHDKQHIRMPIDAI